MKLTFIELPPFERFRNENLSDDEYRVLQNELLTDPEKGDVIIGLGGLRKIRLSDNKRQKGKRGGHRAIYYYFQTQHQIFFVMAYTKNEQEDLTTEQRKALINIVERIKSKL